MREQNKKCLIGKLMFNNLKFIITHLFKYITYKRISEKICYKNYLF